jgi:hypothetical protein
MKIGGKELKNDAALFGPVVIIRGEEKFGIFARPVWSFDEFDKLCPMPEPPTTGWSAAAGRQVADYNSPKYKKMLEFYGKQKWGWLVMQSLAPSELELPGVDPKDPGTWALVDDKLKGESGLSHYEYEAVCRLIDEANSLDDAKMEANRESFLAERALQGMTDPSENQMENSEVSSS